jgi:cytochrome c oxidase cbb3-type subunit 1
MSLMLFVGGLSQGASQNDPSLPFIESVQSVLPYLRGLMIAALLLTISHFIFAFHFGLMLFGLGRTSTVPTFLNPVEAEGTEAHL